MDQEVYNKFTFLMDDRSSLQSMITVFCDEHLYPGKEIKFKSGNMTSEANAVIVHSGCDFRIRPYITVKNLKTGIQRDICFNDIVINGD